MNLNELNALARVVGVDPEEDCCRIQVKNGEVDPKDDPDQVTEEQTMEEDLTEALDYLEQMLIMMESIQVKSGKIVKIPKGMTELMEEASEFLDQWPSGNE